MKSIFLIICMFFLSCSNNKQVCHKHNYISQNEGSYRVYKIDSINNFYLIYAEKNDTLYKIVSKREMESGCNRIQINQSYAFKLTSRRDNAPVINGVKLSPQNYLDIECYVYDDSTSICIERDSINDLHHASNIKGLCFQSE